MQKQKQGVWLMAWTSQDKFIPGQREDKLNKETHWPTVFFLLENTTSTAFHIIGNPKASNLRGKNSHVTPWYISYQSSIQLWFLSLCMMNLLQTASPERTQYIHMSNNQHRSRKKTNSIKRKLTRKKFPQNKLKIMAKNSAIIPLNKTVSSS